MSRKLLKFLILFDNPSLLYIPGQFLTGRVLVELDEETPFHGLFLSVVGEGCVRLRSRGQERLYDKESYIDFRIRLLGETGQGPSLLSPGIHSFPYKLGLPLGLPSTFLGKHGWVQYFCKAALKEPSGLVHKNQQVFIVMSPIDLNLEPPAIAQPFHCEIEHKLNCLTGSVKCKIRLNRGGFIPGTTIQYTGNGKVVYTERRELASLKRPRIKAGGKDEWINEKIEIPPCPPTNLRGSHLIRIQYDLFFVISPRSFDKKIKLQLPILIATYPLRDGTMPRDSKDRYPTILPTYRTTNDTKAISNKQQ
ncbi:Thioredoxin-interacting protein [Folsomia candida]|uniref:Thioredoxin-interacting protein n=1 Tax=Folsomia candida TaxID=158441 RepID=A0A226EXP9_FOLCA|nr:Thioredoxin-interacting protein [Folsomia candida]